MRFIRSLFAAAPKERVFIRGGFTRWGWAHRGGRLAAGGPDHNEARSDRAKRRRDLVLDSPPMDLEVDTEQRGGATILVLRGEIDVYTAPRLRQTIVDLVDGGTSRLVVDMERVDFLDSTGLGVLVEGLKRVKSRGGSLSIVATQDKILKIFDITGLNKAFPIHASVDDAVKEPVSGA